MFTGIVDRTGEIIDRRESSEGAILSIRGGSLVKKLTLGCSIGVDGVCLTVTKLAEDSFEVDASPETLRRSTLGQRELGHAVNLEVPLRLEDFLGGHLVQGHVDGTGRVISIKAEGNSSIYRFEIPGEVQRYCVMKGSVTINGVSLTISGLSSKWIEVTIIPHTLEVTNFSDLKVGSLVNLEADVVSKYVERHLEQFLDRGTVSLSDTGDRS